jgi:alpha-1,3-glucosyltransferase
MAKDPAGSAPSLFINSPVRRSLEGLVQNQALWSAPLVALLFAALVRFAVGLYPYSGKNPSC